MSDWVGFEGFSVGLVHGRLGQLEYLNPLQTCEKNLHVRKHRNLGFLS